VKLEEICKKATELRVEAKQIFISEWIPKFKSTNTHAEFNNVLEELCVACGGDLECNINILVVFEWNNLEERMIKTEKLKKATKNALEKLWLGHGCPQCRAEQMITEIKRLSEEYDIETQGKFEACNDVLSDYHRCGKDK